MVVSGSDPSFIKEAYDAFNYTFDAWHSHPHRHFDRAFRPLIHENAVRPIALRQINRLWGASAIHVVRRPSELLHALLNWLGGREWRGARRA